jgi:5-(carboxyamino)imidazole ribonucleotide synthase
VSVVDDRPLAPGATLGVVGGGQLGRMFAIAARRLGYGVVVLDPTENCPAAAVTDDQIVARFDDHAAARKLADRCDRITFEFENAPASTLSALAERAPVHPRPAVLEICRQRAVEKETLNRHGFPVAPYSPVRDANELAAALDERGPSILKRAEFGYDGKGQARLDRGADTAAAWEAIGAPVDSGGPAPAVLESLVSFERELSVIVARGTDGDVATFPVFENEHVNGILDVTRMPARVDDSTAERAVQLASGIAEALDVVGLLTVELFDTGGSLVVNELAPRPHNSGHVTIEACATCQYEQHVRALCGLPLGATTAVRPGAMVNLLGDLWNDGPPAFDEALGVSEVRLHLYGKQQARPGRKMGHLTALANTPDEAASLVLRARDLL